MEYGPSDSSGTDDDLPPSYQNRSMRGTGRVSANGRAIVGAPYPRAQTDMETQIHQLEQEAYCSVLRAFKAQSDAITWEKEGLITELRKELRVSDKEHRELLNKVNNDDIIRTIREWRQSTGGLQASLVKNAQPAHDPMPSPTTSARKKQKTSQSIPSLSVPAPSPAMHSQPLATPMQPSSSAAKKAAPPGPKGKKIKPSQKTLGVSAVKSMPSSAGLSGRTPIMNRNASGGLAHVEPAELRQVDPLIGRKIKTRWPDDNFFYEAVITDYNPDKVAPEDIRWDGEDPGINQRARGAPGNGSKKSSGRGGPPPGAVRGRGSQKNTSKKDFMPSQNGVGKKSSDEIEILNTESLITEVERLFSASNPDPLEIEKAKKVLKEHEQSLIDAIARLAEASDGESDEHGHQPSEQSHGRRNQHGANYADDTAIDGDHRVRDMHPM